VKVEEVIHTRDTVGEDTSTGSAGNAGMDSYTEKVSCESAPGLG